MGLKDDLKKAAYSAAPRKIEMNRSLTIEELYALLEQHKEEFPVPFKLSSFLGKRITFKREPKLEMQLLVTVKGNVITVRLQRSDRRPQKRLWICHRVWSGRLCE